MQQQSFSTAPQKRMPAYQVEMHKHRWLTQQHPHCFERGQAAQQNPEVVQNLTMFRALCTVKCKVKCIIALMLLLLVDHSQRVSVHITSTRKNCTLGNALRSVCKSLRAL
jgi:hypothetical protein